MSNPLDGAEQARLLTPGDVRDLARALDLRPTKTLGQNFVIDAGTVRRIVRRAELTPDDVVLEVGPGLGSLTLALLERAGRVTAVEVAPALADALPGTVARHAPRLAARLHAIEADALRLEKLPDPQPTALVANLPYNVAVPIVLHLLALLPSLRGGLVMVQSEVADRLVAPPGSRTYGAPSVKTAWYAAAAHRGTVGRAVFWPAPHVDSALVGLTRHDPPPTSATRAEVFEVIDAAFAQRRKTLRAALGRWAGSPQAAADVLTAAGVNPTARGESLDITAFAHIAEHKNPR
jgi:16S rRNA (adenine1518-N6/adenine1519-N6)-dimethyltransferase